MSDEPVGVLIIGAGASGAAFAWSIAETGMSVLCLEQGPWVKQSEYPGNTMDWESRAPVEWSPNPNVRQRPTDYPVNDEASAVSPLMFNGVGGSTILWTAHFPRFTPADFRVRSLDGVAEDWPISYYDLEPHYATNDRMMGVSGLAGDPAYPYHEPPLPMLPFGKLGETLAGGFEKLGWHWWPSDAAITSREYEGRAPCINLGTCGSGCAQGAKASTDITYWPVAQRRGVQLRTGCRVKEITLGADGLANGVLYFDESGTLQEQKAEIVVVACNGVGTSRLLLNSKSERFPDGLANSSGLVGKNLMFHPAAFVTGVFEEEFHSRRGPVSATLWSHEFYHTNRSRGFLRGFSFEAVRGFGPAQTAMVGMAYGRVPWGQGHHEAYAKLFGHTASLVCLTDDLPEEHNAVTLDPVLKDSNGIPAPKVSYTLGENTRKILAFAAERGEQVMRAAGAQDVMIDPQMRNAGWHLMGTARMGRDPKRSVVNEWGRAHDVKNLFVIDGSVFVTGAAVNPTSTIQALALHSAANVKKNLANLFD